MIHAFLVGMNYRRLFLMVGAGGLVASAARPGAAGVEAGAEISGHTGSSSGAWACGPAARVRYGGLGASGRVYADSTRPAASAPDAASALPDGLSLGLGLARENRSYTLIDCRLAADGVIGKTPASCALPPTGPVSALNASVGYDSRGFGMRLGFLYYGRYEGAADPEPAYKVIPEGSFRVGPRQAPHFLFGLGSYDASTMLRPGLWLGGNIPIGTDSFTFGGHLGVHQNFDGDAGLRLHVQLAAALGAGIDAVGGGALTRGFTRAPEPEISLALRFNGGI
jgi:hypothetical protein